MTRLGPQLPLQRLALVPGGPAAGRGPRIRNAASIARLARTYCDRHVQEVALVVLIGPDCRVRGVVELGLGGWRHVTVDARVVCAAGLLAGVRRIVLVHSHPHGGAQPSVEDDQMTVSAVELASYFDLVVEDHVVVGAAGSWYSYAANGRAPFKKAKGSRLPLSGGGRARRARQRVRRARKRKGGASA